jgi:predicted alpha/beta-hydrolase family hydrolase
VRIVDPACASSNGTRSATLGDMKIVIAPGASGRSSSMRSHVEGLAERGIAAQAIDLPLRRAEAAVPAYRLAAAAIASPPEGLVVAGQSYGGRVASLLAAADRGAYAGLICFSYPLHRPGAADWEARTEHWPLLDLPVLLLSGEADPFARIDLLRQARGERLPRAELVTYPRVGHSLRPVLADTLDQVMAFVRAIEGARGR